MALLPFSNEELESKSKNIDLSMEFEQVFLLLPNIKIHNGTEHLPFE
jgi:hypothetical protein